MQISMENLFKKCGYSIETMEIGKPYDIRDRNIKLLSYDFASQSNKYKKVEKLIYKGEYNVWELLTNNNYILLRGKNDHKIWDNRKKNFFKFEDIQDGYGLLKTGEEVYFKVVKTDKKEPIVDLQIEGENYYTNSLLSHNTVLHLFLSESVDDWKKIKEFIKTVMFNTELPSITITPTFSHCQIHGYLKGDVKGVCPQCKQEALNEYNKKLDELKQKRTELSEPKNE